VGQRGSSTSRAAHTRRTRRAAGETSGLLSRTRRRIGHPSCSLPAPVIPRRDLDHETPVLLDRHCRQRRARHPISTHRAWSARPSAHEPSGEPSGPRHVVAPNCPRCAVVAEAGDDRAQVTGRVVRRWQSTAGFANLRSSVHLNLPAWNIDGRRSTGEALAHFSMPTWCAHSRRSPRPPFRRRLGQPGGNLRVSLGLGGFPKAFCGFMFHFSLVSDLRDRPRPCPGSGIPDMPRPPPAGSCISMAPFTMPGVVHDARRVDPDYTDGLAISRGQQVAWLR